MRQFRSDDLIEREATIHIFESKGEACPRHDHDFIEIVYVKEGRVTEFVNEERYELERGDLIFINYGSTHRFLAHGRINFINICFKPESLEGGLLTPENALGVLQLTAFDEIRRDEAGGMISFDSEEQEQIERLLDSMLREYRERSVSWQTALKSYMNVLFIRMLRKTTVDSIGTDGASIWGDLQEYIDENLGAELSLSHLAQKCFYNPSYFSRVFKERFGMPLTEYIARRKLDCARHLRRDEEKLSVAQIAERAGFSSASALYRASLRLTGRRFSELGEQETDAKKQTP